MGPAVRLPVALAAITGLAMLAVHASDLGRANSIVYDAAREVGTWTASGAPPAATTMAWVRDELGSAAQVTPDDPNLEEMLGELALRAPAGADLDEALVHFRRAATLRPSSPYAWADIVTVLYRQGDTGAPFEAALRSAAELGPAEREVQLVVADYGLAVWDEVAAPTRAAVESMVTGAMKRDPAEILQLAQRRGRLAVACRHIRDAPRRVDRQWLSFCGSRETLS
jgi:hypothetical protein